MLNLANITVRLNESELAIYDESLTTPNKTRRDRLHRDASAQHGHLFRGTHHSNPPQALHPGPNVRKLFTSVITDFCNKLEWCTLASLSSQDLMHVG